MKNLTAEDIRSAHQSAIAWVDSLQAGSFFDGAMPEANRRFPDANQYIEREVFITTAF